MTIGSPTTGARTVRTGRALTSGSGVAAPRGGESAVPDRHGASLLARWRGSVLPSGPGSHLPVAAVGRGSGVGVVRLLLAAVLALLLAACGGAGGSGGASGGGSADRAGPEGGPAGGSSVSASGGKAGASAGRSVPVGLRIPAIGVDAPLMRLGLAADGSVQVPPITAHDRAGWYEHSPMPGQKGPSVILGHVTVGPYGDGVFRHLSDLRKGDEIVARLQNGTSAVFAVTGVRTVAKADFPTKEVYGDVPRPELRLITCGGPRTGDGYLDNVIVFAALSSASP